MLSQVSLFGLIFVFPLLLSKPFLFPAAHQTCLRKTTISDSFTFGSSWNFSTMFTTQLQTFSPLRILKLYLSLEENPSHCSILISCRNPKLSRSNYDLGFVNRWIFMKFGYFIRNLIAHTFTVGIFEILFVEGEKGIAWRQYKWKIQSLLRLSDVWEFYRSSQMNNWKNFREPLEMLLSLAEDTWVRSEVRDALFTIGD